MTADIQKCLQTLHSGGTILYPTDTVWGIGCDATNTSAVNKVYQIKQREESKSLIILVSDLNMLATFVSAIPEKALQLMEMAVGPLTIIYPDAKSLASNVVAEDNSIAIRVVKSGFCHELIQAFGKPIVSTSANISGVTTPPDYRLISPEIKNAVDYIVDEKMAANSNSQPSQIIKIEKNGEFRIIRK